MTAERNPWVERFTQLSRETLVRRCERAPQVSALGDCDTELACVRLERALTSVFVVTEKVAIIIERLYLRARAHSIVTYETNSAFLSRCYAEHTREASFIQPLYLTGHAGTGKSCLISALQNLLPRDSSHDIDERHRGFPLCAMWRVAIGGNETPRSALQKLLTSCEGTLPRRSGDLAALCRHHVYLRGISLIVADEFQFGTASADAHARLSSTLKELSSLGAPLVFVGNYSLGRRLKKRPQEERERLLSDPLVLLPDDPDSDDWRRTVTRCRNVAPDVLVFDPSEAAPELFVYTRGLKRLLRLLVVVAYRVARNRTGVVDQALLKAAYLSTEYSDARETVQQLFEMETTGRSARGDLVCPVELPLTNLSRHDEATRNLPNQIHRAAVEASMSVDQGKTLAELREAARSASRKGRSKSKVISLKDFQAGEDLI